MANSSLAVFKREKDEWDWEDYKVMYLGQDRDVPISVMVAVKHRVWCGVGNKVYVIDANTCSIEVRSCMWHLLRSCYSLHHLWNTMPVHVDESTLFLLGMDPSMIIVLNCCI